MFFYKERKRTQRTDAQPWKQLTWTEEMKVAFSSSKEALCNVATLAHPDPAAGVFLAVDASDTHVGAVLQQQARGGGPQPLGFFLEEIRSSTAEVLCFQQRIVGMLPGCAAFPPPAGGENFLH